MTLTPLARYVLEQHRAWPDRAMFHLAAFGPSRREVAATLEASDVERLRLAYKELEDAGLVEKTEGVGRFRKDFYDLYRLKTSASVPAGASSWSRPSRPPCSASLKGPPTTSRSSSASILAPARSSLA